MKIQQLSARQIYLIIFLAVGGLIGYAAYSIKILGLEPCPLCITCLLYTSPSPRDVEESRMPSSA